MVVEMAAHDDNAPCFIFEDVPGTIEGSRVLVNFFGGKRKNMTLGFPTDLNRIELSEGFRVHYAADMKRIPPKYVETGPVMQNVMTGDAIDVTRFPAPQWHALDGGRYIGTGCYNIIRDPDDGWINCGTYRVMIHDAKTLGIYISPGKHGRQMRDKYQARGERDAGRDRLRRRPDELPHGLQRGALRRERVRGRSAACAARPVEVIKGPVTGLPIPANAEIVIEGFVEPDNERIEGPFGEWTGYYASDLRPEPVIDIKAIYYRNDPILLGCVPSASAGRDLPLSRDRALGSAAREHPEGGRARRHRGLGARGRQRAAPARGRHQPALSRPCQAGRPYRIDVPRRRLLRALHDRGRRRHRRVEPRRGDLGAAHALRILRPRSTSSATPGRRRSIRASSPSAGRSATTPTAARSSTPAGRGTGATSFRR